MKWVLGLMLAVLTGSAYPGQPPMPAIETARSRYERPRVIPFPAENPYSEAKAELGRRLFFDPQLSRSGRTACASCHRPDRGWSDGRTLPAGDRELPMARHSPTLLNGAFAYRLGWEGRFRNLEEVSFVAITGAGIMDLSEAEALQRIAAEPGYAATFREAYGTGDVTRTGVEQALATFERTLVAGVAPFDRWLAGDADAMGEAARRGFELFEGKAGCSSCHAGWAFTDGSLNDMGNDGDPDPAAPPRRGFKTPTLRDVAVRAPFMHDGSLPTLEAVVGFYDAGGTGRNHGAALLRPLGLSDGEKDALAAFLRALTSGPERASAPALPE